MIKIIFAIVFILGIVFCIVGLMHIDKRFSREYNQELMSEGDKYCEQKGQVLMDINLVPIWRKPTFVCRLENKEGEQ